MKKNGFGHLKTRLFTIKTSKNVGVGGSWFIHKSVGSIQIPLFQLVGTEPPSPCCNPLQPSCQLIKLITISTAQLNDMFFLRNPTWMLGHIFLGKIHKKIFSPNGGGRIMVMNPIHRILVKDHQKKQIQWLPASFLDTATVDGR